MIKVSVVIPMFNAERYIQLTINSILNQSFNDYEIIIVDDGSTDNSVDIVNNIKDNRIKMYKNEKNYGIAYTRNRAINLSSGEYIALMDNDDIAPEKRLELEVDFLDNNIDIDVVGGHCRFIDSEGIIIKNKQWNVYFNPEYIKAYLVLGNTVASSSALIRKSFIETNDIKFRDNMFGTEDYLFWVECSLCGKIANIDEVLLYWRSGHDNETGRVSINNLNQRNKCIDFIHEYALEKNGFKLTVNEISIINKVFMEEGTVENNEMLKQLYLALKKIAKQAIEMKLDNAEEIVTMCRKRFGEKVGKAFYMWE